LRYCTRLLPLKKRGNKLSISSIAKKRWPLSVFGGGGTNHLGLKNSKSKEGLQGKVLLLVKKKMRKRKNVSVLHQGGNVFVPQGKGVPNTPYKPL